MQFSFSFFIRFVLVYQFRDEVTPPNRTSFALNPDFECLNTEKKKQNERKSKTITRRLLLKEAKEELDDT